jgi:hypothetical protein
VLLCREAPVRPGTSTAQRATTWLAQQNRRTVLGVEKARHSGSTCVCMCVCVCVCVCVYMCVFMCVCTRVIFPSNFLRTHKPAHKHIHIHLYIRIHIYIHAQTHTTKATRTFGLCRAADRCAA